MKRSLRRLSAALFLALPAVGWSTVAVAAPGTADVAAPTAGTSDGPTKAGAAVSGLPVTPEQTAAEGRVHFAKDAWDKGDFDRAETLYREAIERGSLAPETVVECYVRLGSLRSILGKKKGLEAFRAAAILHRNFTLPTEAGKREVALADQARKDTDGFGEITLTAEAPKEAPAGAPIAVTAHLDAAHIAVARKIAFTARDGLYGKEEKALRDVAEKTDFVVPATLAGPGTRISVRVDALDQFGNRLASVENTITIPDGRPKEDKVAKKGGSFWASPWPYVIGGTLLAGGAATGYYLFLRPTDQVHINSVTILR